MTLEQLKHIRPNVKDINWHRHSNGGGWIENTATVHSSAYVDDKSIVEGYAVVKDRAGIHNSYVKQDAVVENYVQIVNSTIEGKARIYGGAEVRDSLVSERASISDTAKVNGSNVYGEASIFGNADVNRCTIRGSAKLYGNCKIKNQLIIDNVWVAEPQTPVLTQEETKMHPKFVFETTNSPLQHHKYKLTITLHEGVHKVYRASTDELLEYAKNFLEVYNMPNFKWSPMVNFFEYKVGDYTGVVDDESYWVVEKNTLNRKIASVEHLAEKAKKVKQEVDLLAKWGKLLTNENPKSPEFKFEGIENNLCRLTITHKEYQHTVVRGCMSELLTYAKEFEEVMKMKEFKWNNERKVFIYDDGDTQWCMSDNAYWVEKKDGTRLPGVYSYKPFVQKADAIKEAVAAKANYSKPTVKDKIQAAVKAKSDEELEQCQTALNDVLNKSIFYSPENIKKCYNAFPMYKEFTDGISWKHVKKAVDDEIAYRFNNRKEEEKKKLKELLQSYDNERLNGLIDHLSKASAIIVLGTQVDRKYISWEDIKEIAANEQDIRGLKKAATVQDVRQGIMDIVKEAETLHSIRPVAKNETPVEKQPKVPDCVSLIPILNGNPKDSTLQSIVQDKSTEDLHASNYIVELACKACKHVDCNACTSLSPTPVKVKDKISLSVSTEELHKAITHELHKREHVKLVDMLASMCSSCHYCPKASTRIQNCYPTCNTRNIVSTMFNNQVPNDIINVIKSRLKDKLSKSEPSNN